MVLPVDKLEEALLELSLEDRAYLAHRLLESLHAAGDFRSVVPDDADHGETIRQRLDELENGTADLIPAEEVMAGYRARRKR